MSILSRAKSVAKRGYVAGRSLPKAAKKFGTTLASEGRSELRNPNSAASRFARAPLGQYYLPKKAQAVGRVLAPTPGGVVKSYQKGAREGGLKGTARIALTNVDIGLLGTAGEAARGVRAAGRGGIALAERGLATRGLSLSSEFGGVRAGSKATKVAQKAVLSMQEPKVGTTAAKAAAAAKADIEASTTAPSKFSSLSDEVIREGLNKLGTSSKALVREAQRRGISVKAGAPDIRPAVGKAMGLSPEATRAGINRQRAMDIAKAGQALGLTPKEMAAAVRKQGVTAVARQLNKAGKMRAVEAAAPAAEEAVGVVSKAKPVAQRATAKAGPVRTRAMTAVEKASFDMPKTSAGYDVVPEKAALGVTRKAAGAAKVATKPAATVATTAPSKAASVAAKGVAQTEETLRGSVRSVLSGKAKRGAFSALAKKHGVSRQRVGEIVKMERKRMGITGAPGAALEEAGSAKTAGLGVARKTTAKAAEAVETIKAPKNVTPAAAEAVAPVAEKAVKIARPAKAAGETGAQAVKGAPSLASRIVSKIPKKTAALAGGAVLVANRDKIGIGRGSGSTPAAKSEERAWVQNLPEGLRKDVEALYEVKDKKGEKGLRALVEGLKAAKTSPEYETEAERTHPELSDKYYSDYTKQSRVIGREAAAKLIVKRVQKRHKSLLQKKVREAYKSQ